MLMVISDSLSPTFAVWRRCGETVKQRAGKGVKKEGAYIGTEERKKRKERERELRKDGGGRATRGEEKLEGAEHESKGGEPAS